VVRHPRLHAALNGALTLGLYLLVGWYSTLVQGLNQRTLNGNTIPW
jgi:hypothetical protein